MRVIVKHEFASIPVATVHINTSCVRVRVARELRSYEQFLCSPVFRQPV